MNIKVIVTRTEEDDGVDQTVTFEQNNVGDHVQDSLRFYLEAMTVMGFTYIESLQANSTSGNTWSSDDFSL